MKIIYSSARVLFFTLCFVSVSLAYDADLEDNPLQLGGVVDPNILLLLDDSGSMYYDVVLTNRAIDLGIGERIDNGAMDFTPNEDGEILRLCPAVNVLAYDENETYKPWSGNDPDGDPLDNIPFPDGYSDPYTKRNGNSSDPVHLTNHFYITYKDYDEDGVFDRGECGPLFSAYDTNRDGTVSQKECLANPSGHCKVPTGVDQQQNYANWYSYVRSKTQVLKAALSEVIDGVENANVGLAAFNNTDGDVGRIVGPLVTIGDRNKLKTELFELEADGGTPLRIALKKAGEYYTVGKGEESVSDLFGTDAGLHDAKITASTDSPILKEDNGGYCQRNTTIVMTDGVWKPGSPGVGDTDLDGVGDWDNDASFRDEAPSFANSLADVAMHYFETDLWPVVGNDIVGAPDPRSDDINVVVNHQHMITTTINFGVSGSLTLDLDSSLDFPFDPKVDGFKGWPAPVDEATKIDDVVHAAWNGRGVHASARSAKQVKDAFERSLQAAIGGNATAAVGSVNTSTLSSDSLLYRSFYDSRLLYGDLVAYPLVDGQFDFNNPSWSADEVMRAKFSGNSGYHDEREIISYQNNVGVAFNEANLGSQLSKSTIDFIRGKNDEPNVRRRPQVNVGDDGSGIPRVLGTFINSAPVYVDDSPAPYPDFIESKEKPYSAYLSTKKTNLGDDNSLIFAGSNDGMLHAFEANTGDELFAYVPSENLLENNLEDLTTAAFNQAYVDGKISVADVFVGDAWRTYLVGGLRTGGKGIYVLDISTREILDDAEGKANDIVVGEFTHPELNFTFSEPQIAKLNDGSWAAIFGNGYGFNDQCTGTNCGQAALFILDLDDFEVRVLRTGEGSVSSTGNNIEDKCLNADSDCNGLSTPTLVDLNDDLKADRVYAGDLKGNMWVFDISNISSTSATNNWNVSVEKLFTACNNFDGSNCTQPQPITSRPRVVSHPTVTSAATSPNLMVYFGSGQYIDSNDHADTNVHSFYGVWDAGNSETEYRNLRANKLQRQVINQSNDGNFRTLSNNTVDYYGSNKDFGWYIELRVGNAASTGERVITEGAFLDDILYFVTIDPDNANCSGGGSSYLMGVNALDGSNADFNLFKGYTYKDAENQDAAGIRLNSLATGITPVGSDDDSADSSLIVSGSDEKVEKVDVDRDNLFSKPAGRRAWSIIH